MIKRIVLVGSFILSLASASWGGEHLDALPGKVEALKNKDLPNLSPVAHNLEIIAERLGTAEDPETVVASEMLQGVNVMASTFDLYVGNNMAADGSYFMRIQAFIQQNLEGSYNREAFAEQMVALIDALNANENNAGAFDAFFTYLLDDTLVVAQDSEDDSEEDLDGDFFGNEDGFEFQGPLVLPTNPGNQTVTDDPFAGFSDDDDATSFHVGAFSTFASQ